jgi:hypothetical protein
MPTEFLVYNPFVQFPERELPGGYLREISQHGVRTYTPNVDHAQVVAVGLQTLTGLGPGDKWHVPGDPATVLDCGHPESSHSDITNGWGTDGEGKRHCLACCYLGDLARMEAGEPITAYLAKSPFDHVISTWNGQVLAHVRDFSVVSCGGFASGHKRTAWRGIGVRDGKRYHGTGPGVEMYTSVRQARDKRRR